MEATLKLRKFQENKWKFELYFLCFFKLLDTIQVNELIAQISGEWKFIIEFFFPQEICFQNCDFILFPAQIKCCDVLSFLVDPVGEEGFGLCTLVGLCTLAFFLCLRVAWLARVQFNGNMIHKCMQSSDKKTHPPCHLIWRSFVYVLLSTMMETPACTHEVRLLAGFWQVKFICC